MTKDQVTSQVLGLSLAAITAMGVIAYERLVKNFPYAFVGMLTSLSYLPFWFASRYFQEQKFSSFKEHWVAITIFLVSGATGPIWYAITRNQGAIIGATYEMKYVVVLGLFYTLVGGRPMTWNIILGVGLALLSFYFISK